MSKITKLFLNLLKLCLEYCRLFSQHGTRCSSSCCYCRCCRLSGLSPFAGESDAETLANVTTGEFDFDADEFKDISRASKDFIEKLLVKQPKYVIGCHSLSSNALYFIPTPTDRDKVTFIRRQMETMIITASSILCKE